MDEITFQEKPLPRGRARFRPYDQQRCLVVRALGDGLRVVSVARRSIRVWCRRTGRLQRLVVPSSTLPMKIWCGIAITLGGTVLFLHRGELYALCLETLTLMRRLDDLAPSHDRLLLSPTDALLAVFGSQGSFRMYAHGPDRLERLYEWSEGSGPSLTFSSDSALLLWEEDIPQQSGSDLAGFGVWDAHTGEMLVAEQATYWHEVAYFSEDETRLRFGYGKAPHKVDLPICRNGEPIPSRGARVRPLHADHYRVFTPFCDALRRH